MPSHSTIYFLSQCSSVRVVSQEMIFCGASGLNKKTKPANKIAATAAIQTNFRTPKEFSNFFGGHPYHIQNTLFGRYRKVK